MTDITSILNLLAQNYPDAHCSLNYSRDYELLFAVRLSAQCTDARVNVVTEKLFRDFPTLESFAAAGLAELEAAVRTCGYFRQKAKDVKLSAIALLENHGGVVPDTLEELVKLPGVGRKTANCVLGEIYRKPSITADTHCIRLSNKLGLARTTDPVKLEIILKQIIPPEEQIAFCHRLISHGRAVCAARNPKCEICTLRVICPSFSGA